MSNITHSVHITLAANTLRFIKCWRPQLLWHAKWFGVLSGTGLTCAFEKEITNAFGKSLFVASEGLLVLLIRTKKKMINVVLLWLEFTSNLKMHIKYILQKKKWKNK